jgi:hypothetical protein
MQTIADQQQEIKRQIANTEIDIAALVVQWLYDLRWDVYQEVQLRYGGPIADIVATQGSLVWGIEVKRHLGTVVIEQARYWLGYCNYVSVATPTGRNAHHSGILYDYLKWKGIGHLAIVYPGTGVENIHERLAPRLHRRRSHLMRKSLRDEHKTFAPAGNAAGKRWTPFQGTCTDILKYVMAHPGTDLKTMLASIRTHYHSTDTAKACIAKWAEKGIIDGVRSVKDGGSWKLYPNDKPK